MLFLTVLALASSATARVALFSRGEQDVCQQSQYADMQNFASYAPAQSSCWAQYPGPTYTVTVPASCKTSWYTSTCTETTTMTGYCPPPGYYTTTPVTYPTTTPTVGPTTTPPGTIYPTPTGGVFRNRRRAEQMAQAWDAQVSAMHENGEGCYSTACSCIQGTKTATVTTGDAPTSYSTATTTVTTTETACSY